MRCLTALITLTVVLAPTGAAQDRASEAPTGGFLFAYEPNPGARAAFYDGYRSHLDWHRAHGDSLDWYG